MAVKVTREAEPQIELYGAYSGQLAGNGRTSLTFTATDTYLIMVPKNAVSRPQLELGSFATSYIPTTASSVTRNADVASVGTSQFPYSATEGTLVASVSAVNNQDIRVYFVQLASGVSGTSYGSSHAIFKGSASGIGFGQKVKGITYDDNNSLTGETVTTANINTEVIKVAYSFAANDFRASVNGDSVISDTSGAMPSAAWVLTIGGMRNGTAGYFLNGHIRQITYIPRKISNSELQTRTI